MGSEESYLEGGMVVAWTATVAAFSMVTRDFFSLPLVDLIVRNLCILKDMLVVGVNWTVLFGVEQRNQCVFAIGRGCICDVMKEFIMA
ncbi:hypothetical protein J1N35_003891 [Gossypium stocksii]|uniref:Uncharacterized protein n=1 Tax=Gossypium stocksii TaxID=47602 RepID=A0A9D3WAQ3_9ROSI|nr:hypothetical protein J1N35_003891 [Gossypium stocksii]